MSEEALPVADQRRQYEQRLVRIGRRLEALGQLLVQDPARVVGKGLGFDTSITGQRPVQIDMDELRALFDPTAADNIGQLLSLYHETLRKTE